MDKVLAFSKKLLKEVIDKNSIVVDATAGNGNDTLFLAKTSAKKVFAFDVQNQAITNTNDLLEKNNLADKCKVILDSHENFDKYIKENIQAVVFNLGYLPNADHTITTQAETTLNTINKFITRLNVGGRIVIVVYWGHENGKVEKDTLLKELSKLDQKEIEVLVYQFINQKNNAPFVIALEKKKGYFMREIEIEFKNLLTEDEYNNLFTSLKLEDKPQIINKNFYYDDANENLKKANSALRIRYTNNKDEMTLKIKGSKQNVEINIPLDESFPKEPTVLPIVPNEIITELENIGVKIKTPMLTQKIETIRYELPYKSGLLVVDKTTFLNDIVDYELEFEVKDYNIGLEEFKSLLSEFNIEERKAKPKIARAMEYSKK